MRRLVLAIGLLLCTKPSAAQAPPRILRNVGTPRTLIANDTMRFGLPTLIRAAGDRAYIFDYNDGSVRAFALRTGGLLWQTGKFGRAPGEFSSPNDLEVAPDSSIWINDPQQGRITVLSRDGALVRTINVAQRAEKIVVGARQGFIGVDLNSVDKFAAVFDSAGHPARAIDAPPGYTDLQPLARAVMASRTATGIAVAFGYTGRIEGVPITPGAPAIHYRAAETRLALQDTVITTAQGWHVRQPNPNAALVVRYLSVYDGVLYALAGADTGKEGHFVDAYDTKTGAYKYSWLLPVEVGAMDVTREGIVTLQAVNERPAMIFYPFPPAAPRTVKR